MAYKIRGPKGFSNGGLYPRFTKTGKTWATLGHLKAHLSLVRKSFRSALRRL